MSPRDELQPFRGRLIARRAKLGAVALRHAPAEAGAPRVVAKGQGPIAERILDLAREAHVPISADRGLLELLAQAELGQEIPVELYQAVAELLHYLYRLDGRLPELPSASARGAVR